MSSKRIEPSQVTSLLLGLEQRGREATGVVLVDKDSCELHILKDAMCASNFIESSKYKAFLEEHLTDKTRTVLVHDRLHTIGHPRDNSNNHPLFAENCAVVHNGHVSNHREMFEKLKLARKAEVDSDIIRAICDSEGLTHKTVRELSKLSGSIAAAIIDKRRPNSLLLLRSGNPLCLGISEDAIIFASIQKVVAAASKTWVKRWGVWGMKAAKDIEYSIFPSDSAWFFGPEGREWHQKFETAAYCYAPSYGRYGAWWDNEDEFSEAEVDLCGRGGTTSIYRQMSGASSFEHSAGASHHQPLDESKYEHYYRCPNIKCNHKALIDDTNRNTSKGKLECPKCNTNLWNAIEVTALKRSTD